MCAGIWVCPCTSKARPRWCSCCTRPAHPCPAPSRPTTSGSPRPRRSRTTVPSGSRSKPGRPLRSGGAAPAQKPNPPPARRSTRRGCEGGLNGTWICERAVRTDGGAATKTAFTAVLLLYERAGTTRREGGLEGKHQGYQHYRDQQHQQGERHAYLEEI